jgi:hypothetical protein
LPVLFEYVLAEIISRIVERGGTQRIGNYATIQCSFPAGREPAGGNGNLAEGPHIMDQFFIALFGVKDHLTIPQEGARAVLIFAYGLLLLRACGPRMFGHWSALDIVISIMIGSALARAMTGSAPLLGTMVAAAVMASLHVVLSHCAARNRNLAYIFEGKAVNLIDHGRIDHRERKRNMISEADLQEALRQEGIDGEAHVGNVKAMMLEPSGKLSVIKIDPCKPDVS